MCAYLYLLISYNEFWLCQGIVLYTLHVIKNPGEPGWTMVVIQSQYK